MIRVLANLAAALAGAALSSIGRRLEEASAPLDDDLMALAEATGVAIAPGCQPPNEFDGVQPTHPALQEELSDRNLDRLVRGWATS